MKTTYVWRRGAFRDKRTGELMATDPNFVPSKTVQIMSDTAEYVSPFDFKTVITSRSQTRELERRHGARQVGNDIKAPFDYDDGR